MTVKTILAEKVLSKVKTNFSQGVLYLVNEKKEDNSLVFDVDGYEGLVKVRVLDEDNYCVILQQGKRYFENDLEGTSFVDEVYENLEFNNVNLKNAVLNNVTFKNCKFKHCDFSNITGSSVTFIDCEVSFSTFLKLALSVVTVNNSLMKASDFIKSKFETLEFTDSNLVKSDFKRIIADYVAVNNSQVRLTKIVQSEIESFYVNKSSVYDLSVEELTSGKSAQVVESKLTATISNVFFNYLALKNSEVKLENVGDSKVMNLDIINSKFKCDTVNCNFGFIKIFSSDIELSDDNSKFNNITTEDSKIDFRFHETVINNLQSFECYNYGIFEKSLVKILEITEPKIKWDFINVSFLSSRVKYFTIENFDLIDDISNSIFEKIKGENSLISLHNVCDTVSCINFIMSKDQVFTSESKGDLLLASKRLIAEVENPFLYDAKTLKEVEEFGERLCYNKEKIELAVKFLQDQKDLYDKRKEDF